MSEPAVVSLGARLSATATRRPVPHVVAVLCGLGLSCAAFAAVQGKGWFSSGGAYDVLATALLVAAGAAGLGCGVVLRTLRPQNPSGLLAYGLGAVLCIWAIVVTSDGPAARYATTSVILLRPLLYWLVLAWPIGHLARSDRRWLLVYTAVLASCWSAWILVDPTGASSVPPFRNRLAVVDLPRLSTAFNAFAQNVVLPAGAVIVLVTVVRRYRRLPIAARTLGRSGVVVGVLAATGDIALVVIDRFFGDLARHGDSRTALGGIMALLDMGRFVAVPIVLVWAVSRTQRVVPTARVRAVEIGPAAARVQDAIALALGDDSVRLAYHRNGGWFDGDGLPVSLGGPGRRVTMIEREGDPIAAVDHDERFDDRPTTVEVAVAAVASAMEHDRLAALARSRLREASDARRTIVEVEDAARRRIERDLHDGAQQRLVGLALQASLAERAGQADVELLATGVEEARADLHDLAAGVLPSILAERGLSAAITTLVATTPLAVEVQVSLPASLPPPVAAAAWFVVAEAVANTVKHAGASSLRIDGAVAGGRLRISVADDGAGGAAVSAGSGLRGLQDRARDLGGRVTVESEDGRGTVVRLDVPVAT